MSDKHQPTSPNIKTQTTPKSRPDTSSRGTQRRETPTNVTTRGETGNKQASKTSETPAHPKPTSGGISVTALIAKLASKNAKDWYKALIDLRTNVLKLPDGVQRIRLRGGPQALLNMLEHGDEKVLDVTLSILGNCCMDDGFRKEIIQRDGVSIIGVVLQETKSTSIQNRSCRTLGNIALDSIGCQKIHSEESLLEYIIRILAETKDRGSQQTFIRTIRLLSDTKPHRTGVLQERGLKIVADLLSSEDKGVMMAALKTVSHFISEHPTEQCALQLDLAGTCKFFLESITEGNQDIVSNLHNLILMMVKHECYRPGLGNAGFIQYFMEKILSDDVDYTKKLSYVNAMCLFSKETLNRVRIREEKGLEMMMDILANDSYKVIHCRVISAFCCFLYDEPSFIILLENNIVRQLVIHLRRSIDLENENEVESKSYSLLLDEFLRKLLLDLVVEEDEEVKIDLFEQYKEEGPASLGCENVSNNIDKDVNIEMDNAASLPEIYVSVDKVDDQDEEAIQTNSGKRSATKYSMDSPTYKEITEAHCECNYDPTGPTNIRDCQDLEGLSPPYHSPSRSPGSPFSISSSYSESYSPLSGVSMYVSPDWSPSSSPTREDAYFETPKRAFSESGNSPIYTSKSPPLHVSHTWPGQFSPLHVTGYDSPTKESYNLWSFSDNGSEKAEDEEGSETKSVVLEYSSEEQDEDETRAEQTEKAKESIPITNVESEVPVCEDDSNRMCLKSSQPNSVNKTDKEINLSYSKSACHSDPNSHELVRSGPVEDTTLECNILEPVESESDIDHSPQALSDDNVEENTATTSADSKQRLATEANILMFLSRVSFMDNPSKYLANNLAVEGLLDYILSGLVTEATNWSRAQRILLRILKYAPILDKLFLAGIPIIVALKCGQYSNFKTAKNATQKAKKNFLNQKSKIEKHSLDGLSVLAQQRYGLGVMKHILLTGTLVDKTKAYLSIPLLYSDKNDMKEFTRIFPQGFDIVVHCLASDEDVLFSAAVIFLSYFTKSYLGQSKYRDWHRSGGVQSHMAEVGLFTRKRKRSCDNTCIEVSKKRKDKTQIDCCSENLKYDDRSEVTFKLPDGSQVSASRSVLAASSSVFSAMFDGSFSEASQSAINISDVDSTAFALLVNHLHSIPPEVTTNLNELPIDTILGLLTLTERYQIQTELHYNVCLRLEELIQSFDDSHKEDNVCSAIKILHTSLLHSPYITDKCLPYLLNVGSSLPLRVSAVKNFLSPSTGIVSKTTILTCLKSFLNSFNKSF